MTPLTPKDVEFTLVQIAQAARAAMTLHPTDPAAESVERDAAGLLQLWSVQESEAAIDEVLARMANTANSALGQAHASQVWHLMARKIEVARAFVAELRKQQEEARAIAGLIDDGAGV